MKQLTQWGNNDVKPATDWSNSDQKAATSWANNDVKNLTTYVPVAKNSDSWAHTATAPQTYFYNDPTIPYNSPMFDYNYRVNTNTLNQLGVTPWSAA